LESRVGVEVVDSWAAHGAGNVALLRVDGLAIAAIPLTNPRVDQHSARASLSTAGRRKSLDLLEIQDARPLRRPRLEVAGVNRRNLRLEGLAPALPSRIEDRLGTMPEPTEEEPQPGRDRATRIVVDDDLGRVAYAGPAHLVLKLLL